MTEGAAPGKMMRLMAAPGQLEVRVETPRNITQPRPSGRAHLDSVAAIADMRWRRNLREVREFGVEMPAKVHVVGKLDRFDHDHPPAQQVLAHLCAKPVFERELDSLAYGQVAAVDGFPPGVESARIAAAIAAHRADGPRADSKLVAMWRRHIAEGSVA